jgi:glycosyltransferase involved in cell wall biosynthesis
VQQPEVWFDGSARELEDLAYNVPFLLAAFAQARTTRPKIIYQRHTAFNCSGAILSRLLNVPLVLEYNSSELWKGQYWGGLNRRRAAELVERINLAAASRVVVVSRVLRDQLINHGVPTAKIVINPNAVDPERFRPDIDGTLIRKKHKLDEREIVVGFSGTFGHWHGIPTLVRAIELVDGVRWLLIGDGPLRNLVDHTRPNVVLTGLVPHAEVPSYLAACDILVSPHGRQADGGEFFGSPTKLYEYMAMGKPIVASAVGQIADVLEDGRSALLVPPDDPHALCVAIGRLVADPTLRNKLGEQARHDAISRHTWLQNAQRVLE